jgi:hypothetical protein
MTDMKDTRRGVLSGAMALAAGGAMAAEPENMPINDPDVVRELEAKFKAYDKALGENDVPALNGFFFDDPRTIRYGIGENLYGFSEIKAYRSGVASASPPQRERTVVTAYGKDFGTVATLSAPTKTGRITRTMQTWVRFPIGWRIVAAHVSFMS